MRDKRIGLVTCANMRQARRIARNLVENRLAAGVNVLLAPVHSVYWWKGKVQEAREVLLFIQTTRRRFPRLERRIRQLHSYEVPEIIALPIVQGSPAYLKWIQYETHPTRPRRKPH